MFTLILHLLFVSSSSFSLIQQRIWWIESSWLIEVYIYIVSSLKKKIDSAMGKRKNVSFGFTKPRPNSDPVVNGSFWESKFLPEFGHLQDSLAIIVLATREGFCETSMRFCLYMYFKASKVVYFIQSREM